MEIKDYKLKDKIQLMRTLQLFRSVEFLVDDGDILSACWWKSRFLSDKVLVRLILPSCFQRWRALRRQKDDWGTLLGTLIY
jgi:hypothetical protein